MKLLIDIGEGVLQKIRKDEWCEREVLGAVCFAVINGKEVKDGKIDNKWISVTERLPDPDEYVLCSVNKLYESDLEIIIAQFHDEGWWKNGRIKAWMPLPEPYKADKKDCTTCIGFGDKDYAQSFCHDCIKDIQNHYKAESEE